MYLCYKKHVFRFVGDNQSSPVMMDNAAEIYQPDDQGILVSVQ